MEPTSSRVTLPTVAMLAPYEAAAGEAGLDPPAAALLSLADYLVALLEGPAEPAPGCQEECGAAAGAAEEPPPGHSTQPWGELEDLAHRLLLASDLAGKPACAPSLLHRPCRLGPSSPCRHLPPEPYPSAQSTVHLAATHT
jgi:hypothetical protein